jgi:aryl-alcohol dehydrogenase-like predicted oxidoreductase
MNYKRLGRSGLKVSPICLGTNNFGGQVSEQDSIKIISKAIELGMNLIDTANTYTNGMSEKIIGKSVKGYRDDVIIATKVGSNFGQGPNKGGLSRKHLLWQICQSLENLQTDFVTYIIFTVGTRRHHWRKRFGPSVILSMREK